MPPLQIYAFQKPDRAGQLLRARERLAERVRENIGFLKHIETLLCFHPRAREACNRQIAAYDKVCDAFEHFAIIASWDSEAYLKGNNRQLARAEGTFVHPDRLRLQITNLTGAIDAIDELIHAMSSAEKACILLSRSEYSWAAESFKLFHDINGLKNVLKNLRTFFVEKRAVLDDISRLSLAGQMNEADANLFQKKLIGGKTDADLGSFRCVATRTKEKTQINIATQMSVQVTVPIRHKELEQLLLRQVRLPGTENIAEDLKTFNDFSQALHLQTNKFLTDFISRTDSRFPGFLSSRQADEIRRTDENGHSVIDSDDLPQALLSYVGSQINEVIRREELGKIAKSNVMRPVFTRIAPLHQVRQDLPHAEIRSEAREEQFAKRFLQAGASREEVASLWEYRGAISHLSFLKEGEILEYYRKKRNAGYPEAKIFLKLGKIDAMRSHCCGIVFSKLLEAGIAETDAQTIARCGIGVLALKCPRQILPESVLRALGESILDVLVEAGDRSLSVESNLVRYEHILQSGFFQANGENCGGRKEFGLPEEALQAAIAYGVDSKYVSALLSSMRFDGTVFSGKANIQSTIVRKKAMNRLLRETGTFNPNSYSRAEKFLCDAGVLEVRGGRRTYHLTLTGEQAQTPLARSLVGAIRAFYEKPKPGEG